MRILALGKRHYTHKDALLERFGRIYQLPLQWHGDQHRVELALLDYHSSRCETSSAEGFDVASYSAIDPRSLVRLLRQARRFRPDAVVASGDCFIGLVGLWLARRAGASFAFDVYDDYRQFGAYRVFLGWDAYGYLLRRADMVFYASHALAEQHDAASPWHMVPNGIDAAMFKPVPMAVARARVGLADACRWVGYFGGMEPERGAADLIEAVGLLHAHDPRIRLVLCGKQHPETCTDAPWVDDRGSVAHARIPDFINACDVVALPYRRGPIIDMASSCKIAEYLFCERPVVATDTPNLVLNFPDQARELGAALCSPGDPADLARAIECQLRTPSVASRPEQHTWRGIARDTLAVLQGLLP